MLPPVLDQAFKANKDNTFTRRVNVTTYIYVCYWRVYSVTSVLLQVVNLRLVNRLIIFDQIWIRRFY